MCTIVSRYLVGKTDIYCLDKPSTCIGILAVSGSVYYVKSRYAEITYNLCFIRRSPIWHHYQD